MAVDESYLAYILEQLTEMEGIETKRMFGGVGFFKTGLMFGKIGNRTFRLKVGESNRKDYENYGMKPYYSEKKKKGMPYWEVPIEILENKTQLKIWAEKALEIAKESSKKK